MIKTIIQNKKLLWNLAKDDFKGRFAGSKLGIIWGFIQPLVTIVIYWFVFSVGFRSGAREDGTPYILWLIAGIIPWFFFAESWPAATNCLSEYSFLVKKVLFKIELLPVVKMMSAFFVHAFFVGLMLIIYGVYGKFPTIYYIQLIYYIFCEVMLIYALSRITSSLAAFSKDISLIIGIILQVFFWMIPIVWDSETFPLIVIRILKLNPLYYVIDGFRDCMVTKTWFVEKPLYTLYYWVFVLILLGLGKKIYSKCKPYFADVL